MVGVSFEAMAGLAASMSGAAGARSPLRIRVEIMRSSSWGSLRQGSQRPLPFSRGPSRAPLSPHFLARVRQRYGEIDRLNKARLARDSAARYVEGRPMVDGRPDDGKAERDVDAAQRLPAAGRLVDGEAEQLHRDVALVVIHGDHGVELLRPQLHEHGVAGHRPVDIIA